jgi:Flp pilus assembly protein TadD
MKYGFIVSVLLLFKISLMAESADVLWEKAFSDFSSGEKALRLKNGDDAEGYFRQALTRFIEIRSDYPKWESGSVNFRINECRANIAQANKIRQATQVPGGMQDLTHRLEVAIREKENYSSAMMVADQKNKVYQREIEILRKLVAQAQKSASDDSSKSSALEESLLTQYKLKLQLKEKNRELGELKNSISGSISGQNKKREAELATKAVSLAKKEKALDKRIAELDKAKKRSDAQYDALRVVHVELKELALRSESELKKSSSQNTELREANEEVRIKHKKLLGEIKDLTEQSEKFKKKSLDARKREDELRKSVETKLSVDVKLMHDLQKNYDDLRSKYTDLNLKLATSEQGFLESEGRLTQREQELMRLKLKYEDVKNKLIIRDTSLTNKLKNELVALEVKLQKTETELLNKTQLISLYTTRLDSSSTQLKKVMADYQLLRESAPAGVGKPLAQIDDQALKYIESYKLAEARNKALNTELMQLRNKIKESEKASLLQEDELIQKLVEYKEKYKETKSNYDQLLLKKSLGSTEIVTQSTTKASDEVTGFIYEAYKASTEGEYQVALGFYAKALELDSQNFDALLRTGLLYYERNQSSEAERYLTRAFYLSPDDTNVLVALGMCLSEKGEYLMAISLLSRAAALVPENADVRFNLGAIMQAQGWNKSALIETEQAYRLRPNDPQILMNLTILYLAQTPKRVVEAKAMYAKALELGASVSPQLQQILGVEKSSK